MKLGLMFVNSGPFSNPALLTHLATTAERCGIESMWTVEHVVIPQDYKSPYPYSSSGKIPGGGDQKNQARDGSADSSAAASALCRQRGGHARPAVQWTRDSRNRQRMA